MYLAIHLSICLSTVELGYMQLRLNIKLGYASDFLVPVERLLCFTIKNSDIYNSLNANSIICKHFQCPSQRSTSLI